jgi:membrane protease YdiL (CAAX protease family)
METCSIQELIYFDTNLPTASFGKQLLVALLSVIVNNIIFNLVYKFMPGSDRIQEDSDQEYSIIESKAVSPIAFGISEIVNGGLYAPIVEELFFRFLLFKIVLVKIYGFQPNSANFLQAILFGVMHMTNVITSPQSVNRTLLQTLSASIGGFLSGWTYVYTNSLLTPIMAHMINNLIATSSEVIEYSHFYDGIPNK